MLCAMRRHIYTVWTYLEFFLSAVLLLPAFAWVAARHGSDPTRRLRGRMMRRFGRWTSKLTPFWDFRVSGEPPEDVLERAYVVIANHESTADPFLLSSLPWDMRWVAKEELFRLPLIGWLMRLGGDIPLRRGDRDSVASMFEECRRTLAHGLPVMVFPEGTRSPDGRLLPFKDGAFRLAIETGAPLLLVAIAGTRQCRPKGSLGFGFARAEARVLGTIETAGLTAEDLPRLRELARARIAEGVRTLRAELGIEAVAPETPAAGLADATA
jgi:1-acyl-sn-glycerol-3-phosphate acyltransferase